MDLLVEAIIAELTKLEADLALPQVSQAAMTTTTSTRRSLVREAIEQTMAKTGEMIEATMEAIKSDSTLTSIAGP